MRFNWYVAAILLLSCGTAFGQSSIDYHPNGVLRLGFGYEPKTPTVPFVSVCVSHEGSEAIDTPSGVALGSVEVSEVTDRKALLSAVGISTSMEAHSALFSGGASFSQNVGVSFDESTLVWVARVKVNFGRYRLKNPTPTSLLSGAANAAQAMSRCGSEIVTQESRGAVAAVVYEVHNLNASEKQELSTALNAKYSGPTAGASFDAAYKAIAQKIHSRTSIKTYAHVQGGPGTAALAPFVSATDLAAVRAALAEYARGTNHGNSAPLSYQTSPLSQFSTLQIQAPPNLTQDRLWEIYAQYENLMGLIRRIDFLIKPTSEAEQFLVKYVNVSKRQELNDVRALYESARSALKASAIACLTGLKGCSVPEVIGRLPRVDWPPIPPGLALVGIYRCGSAPLNLAYALGSPAPPPPQTGTKIGFIQFKLALSGDASLFDSVWLIAPDSRIPLKASVRTSKPVMPAPPSGPLTELQKEIAFIQAQLILIEVVGADPVPQLFEPPLASGPCTARTGVDKSKLFGGVAFGVDERKNIPLGAVEVLDKLGRRSVFDLDKFN